MRTATRAIREVDAHLGAQVVEPEKVRPSARGALRTRPGRAAPRRGAGGRTSLGRRSGLPFSLLLRFNDASIMRVGRAFLRNASATAARTESRSQFQKY